MFEEKTLKEMVFFYRGLTYKKSDEVEYSDNIVLRANNIDLQRNVLILDDLKYLRSDYIVPDLKKVKKNTILICIASGSKIHLGKVALIDKDYNYAFGGFMGLLVPNDNIDVKYLFYNLTTEEYRNYVESITGTNINNLKFSDIENFKLVIPPLEEQKSIVSKLDKIFDILETLEQKTLRGLDIIDSFFKSYLNSIFDDNLEDLKEETLDEACEFISAGGDKPKNFNKIKTDKLFVPVYSNGVEREGLQGYTDKATIKDKSITVSARGTIGFICKRLEPYTPIVRLISLIPKSYIDLDFLYYFLHLLVFNNSGASTPQLTVPNFKKNTIKFPTIEKQKQIVKKIENVEENVNKIKSKYQRQLEIIKKLKKNILKDYLSNNNSERR